MGLFRKKQQPATAPPPPPAPAGDTDLDALRTELEELRERLDASERGRLVVEQRLAELDERHPDASTLAPPPPPAADAGAPTLPPVVRLPGTERERLDAIETRLTAIDRIHERLNALSATVSQQELTNTTRADAAIADESMLNDISNRVEDLSAAVASHYTQIAATRERLDSVDDLDARIAALQEVIESLRATPRDENADDQVRPDDDTRAQLNLMTERLMALDERITSVSLELANQLNELSGDLEGIGAGERGASDIDERIETSLEAIRSGQERLAAEQARYEIQFRADLADLADRLRRS